MKQLQFVSIVRALLCFVVVWHRLILTTSFRITSLTPRKSYCLFNTLFRLTAAKRTKAPQYSRVTLYTTEPTYTQPCSTPPIRRVVSARWCVAGLCTGRVRLCRGSPVALVLWAESPGGLPSQKYSNTESVPMPWRHANMVWYMWPRHA